MKPTEAKSNMASAVIRMLSRQDESEQGRVIMQGLPAGALEVACDRLEKHAATARMLVDLSKKFGVGTDEHIESVVQRRAEEGNTEAQAIVASGLLDVRLT